MVLMVCPDVTYRYLKWILACVQASLSGCKAAEILVLSIGAINRSICWILGTSNIGMGIQEIYNSYNQPFAGHFTSSNLQYTKRVYTCAICTKIYVTACSLFTCACPLYNHLYFHTHSQVKWSLQSSLHGGKLHSPALSRSYTCMHMLHMCTNQLISIHGQHATTKYNHYILRSKPQGNHQIIKI